MDEDDGKKSAFRSGLERAVSAVRDAANRTVQKIKEAAQLDFYARFKSEEILAPIDFSVDMGHDTVWATQAQMADLFGVDQSVVSKHITGIFANRELEDDAATHAKFALVQNEGGRQV